MKSWKYILMIMIGLLSLTLMSCGSSSNGSGDSGKLLYRSLMPRLLNIKRFM